MADSAKFCSVCGSALEAGPENNGGNRKKNEKRKKALLAGLACLCIGAACLTGAWFVRADNNPEKYAEAIGYAEKYLIDQDYGRAEEYYLEAKKIDPKQPEPYEGLYEIYVATDQSEKAEEIEKEAHENLEQESQDAFDERTEEIDEEYTYVNSYEILSDLGQLDMIPLNLNDQVWLIKKNGAFSFLNPEGRLVNQMDTENAIIRSTFDDYGLSGSFSDGERIFPVCLADADYTPSQKLHPKDQWPNPDGVLGQGNICSNPMSYTATLEYTLNDENRPVLSQRSLDSFEKLQFDPAEAEVISEPFYLRKNNQTEGEYYIWNPVTEEAIGPYKEEKAVGFGKTLSQIEGLEYVSDEPGQFKDMVLSPFWKADDESNRVVLYSVSGVMNSDLYDSAIVTDAKSIGAVKGGLYYLLDSDLNTDYVGYFDEGSKSIDHIAPVKINGTWKLVEFGELIRAKDMVQTTESEEDPEDLTAVLSEIAGEYLQFVDFKFLAAMTINDDLTFSYINSNKPTNFEIVDGEVVDCVAMTKFHGKLSPNYDASGKLNSFTIKEIVFDYIPGTEEFFPAGTLPFADIAQKVSYTEWEYIDYGVGDIIKVNSPGTPFPSYEFGFDHLISRYESNGIHVGSLPFLSVDSSEEVFIKREYLE